MALRISQTIVKVLGASDNPEVRIAQLSRNILVQNVNAYIGDGNIQVSFTIDNPSCGEYFTPNKFFPASGNIQVSYTVDNPSCGELSDIGFNYSTCDGLVPLPANLIQMGGGAAGCIGSEIEIGGEADLSFMRFFDYVGTGGIQVSHAPPHNNCDSVIRLNLRYITCNGTIGADMIVVSGQSITLLHLFYTGTGLVQVSWTPTNPSCAVLRRLCPGELNIITVNGCIPDPVVVRNNTDCKFEGGFPCPIPEEGNWIDCAIGRWYNPRCKNINFLCGCPSFPRNPRGPNKVVTNGFLAPVIACRQHFFVPVPQIDPFKDDYAERTARIGGPFEQVNVGGIVKARWGDKKKVRFSQLKHF